MVLLHDGEGKRADERRAHVYRARLERLGFPVHADVAHDAAAESRDENDDENAYRIDFLAFDGKKSFRLTE